MSQIDYDLISSSEGQIHDIIVSDISCDAIPYFYDFQNLFAQKRCWLLLGNSVSSCIYNDVKARQDDYRPVIGSDLVNKISGGEEIVDLTEVSRVLRAFIFINKYDDSCFLYSDDDYATKIFRQGFLMLDRFSKLDFSRDEIVVARDKNDKIEVRYTPNSPIAGTVTNLERAGILVQVDNCTQILEGGNFLVSRTCILVGINEFRDPSKIQAAINFFNVYNDSQKKLIVVGNFGSSWESFNNIFFHIDMFITILNTEPDGKTNTLLGRIDTNCNLTGNTDPVLISLLNSCLNDVESQLVQSGFFNVIRCPLPVYENTPLPYNNCIVEIYEGQKNIFLPDYNLENIGAMKKLMVIKHEVNSILSNLSFKTKYYEGDFLTTVALNMGGSLHCICSEIRY